MPIAVQAVPPAQFAAWVAAKGGQMPGSKAPSSAVIPQPGAEGSAVEAAQANAAEAVTGPADNMAVPAQSPTSAQGATGNPAGPGNAGQ
jgi:cytochrome c oxidase subunit 2